MTHAPDHRPSATICVSATSGRQRGIPFELAAPGDSASPVVRNRPGGPQCHNRRPETHPRRKSHQHQTLARPAPVTPRPVHRAFRRRRRVPTRRRATDLPGRRRATRRPAIPRVARVKAVTRPRHPNPRPDISRASRRAARRRDTRAATSQDRRPASPSRAATPSRDRHRDTRRRVPHPAIRNRATTSHPPATLPPAVHRPATVRQERPRATRHRRVTHRRRALTRHPVRPAAHPHPRSTSPRCPSPGGG